MAEDETLWKELKLSNKDMKIMQECKKLLSFLIKRNFEDGQKLKEYNASFLNNYERKISEKNDPKLYMNEKKKGSYSSSDDNEENTQAKLIAKRSEKVEDPTVLIKGLKMVNSDEKEENTQTKIIAKKK